MNLGRQGAGLHSGKVNVVYVCERGRGEPCEEPSRTQRPCTCSQDRSRRLSRKSHCSHDIYVLSCTLAQTVSDSEFMSRIFSHTSRSRGSRGSGKKSSPEPNPLEASWSKTGVASPPGIERRGGQRGVEPGRSRRTNITVKAAGMQTRRQLCK